MTTGMLQLFVIGFDGNEFNGHLVPELNALREHGTIRLVDLAFVLKDQDGRISSARVSDLTEDEKLRMGMTAGALIGFGAAGIEGAEIGAEAGAEAVMEGDFGIDDEDIDEIASHLDYNCSSVVMLVEHLWSIPLKEAIIGSNGRMIAQWVIQPESLIALGQEMATAALSD